MNDDEMLAELRRAARASRDEETRDAVDDADAAFLRGAQAPLDAGARGRIADALVAKVKQGQTRATTTGDVVAKTPPRNVVPLRPSRLRYATMLAGAVAVAASIALLVGRSAHDDAGGALPAYALVVTGGDREVRSGSAPTTPPGGEIHVGEGSRVALVVRPATAVVGAVEARGFVGQDGVFTAWSAPLETAEGGAVRVAGLASTLFAGRKGAVDVAIVVGRVGAVPTEAARALAPGQTGVQIVRCRVVLGPAS